MANKNQEMINKGFEVLRIAEEDLHQQGIELEEIEFQEIEYLDFCNSDAVKFTFTATEYEYDDFGEQIVVPIKNQENFDELIGETIQLSDVYYVNAFSWIFVESDGNKFTCWLPF